MELKVQSPTIQLAWLGHVSVQADKHKKGLRLFGACNAKFEELIW